MRLIMDGKDFSADLRLPGFIFICMAGIVLIVFPLVLLVSPPRMFAGAVPAVMIGAIGAVIVLLMLGIYLKSRGMLFKLPLRVFDEGVMIQPIMGLKPAMIPYQDIASMEIWFGLGYKKAVCGCSILSFKGSVHSVETFRDKEDLRRFVDGFRLTMENNGLKMKPPEEEAGSLHFVFQRDVVKRRPAA
ncbi:MAG: hypothetical protein U0R44_06040 [Candidatus Micrarchaeia archaeon]